MNNNLIPSFVMREAGIIVSKMPKIHLEDLDVKVYSVYFAETKLRIYLSLLGVFSYLPMTKPTEEVMIANEEVYLLTFPNWNSHNPAYTLNEASMLDWQGGLKPPIDRKHILLSDIGEDKNMSNVIAVGNRSQRNR